MIIEEGGNAVSGRRIEQREVKMIYDKISDILYELGFTDDEFMLLGSAGKKKDDETSGDIDIAVKKSKMCSSLNCTEDDIYTACQSYLEGIGIKRFYISKAFGELSFGLPVNNEEDVIQVDFMFTDNLKWASFIHTSPDYKKGESKYKNLYRNALLKAFASVVLKKTTHSIVLPDGEEIGDELEVGTVRYLDGLIRTRKNHRGAKPYSIVSNGKTMHEYDELITDVPEEFIDLFFDGATIKDFTSFETLYAVFMSDKFKYPEMRDEIIYTALEEIESCKYPIPDELESYAEATHDFISNRKQTYDSYKEKLKAYKKTLKENYVMSFSEFIDLK